MVSRDELPWGKAVRTVAGDGRVTLASIADAIGVNKGLLTQYLSGRCHPTEARVREINREVGNRTKKDATDHLNTVAALCGLLAHDSAALEDLAVETLRTLAAGRLSPGWETTIGAWATSKTDRELATFAKALTKAHAEELSVDLTFKVAATRGLDRVRRVLTRFGLLHVLDESPTFVDPLRAAVRSAIASVADPKMSAVELLAAEAAVIRAAWDYADEHHRQLTDPQTIVSRILAPLREPAQSKGKTK